MNGQDPRRLSDIYTLVLDIDEFSDGVPSASDWAEVVDLVMNRYKYYPVPLSESMNATKTLAEYIYPKRKQIDIRESSALDDAVTRPLTPEEVDLFAERFNDEF